jgi:hypothetical protein
MNRTQDTRLLVVFDDSDASVRAVRYVAKLVARRRQFRICLAHVLPPFPPALMEHGGSQDPIEERQLDLALRTEQGRWITTVKERAQKCLDQAVTVLRRAGVSGRAVRTLLCEPGESQETADSLLGMAKKCQCRTVVVGRSSVSWLHELFSQDLSEELLRRGKGFCIWAIE